MAKQIFDYTIPELIEMSKTNPRIRVTPMSTEPKIEWVLEHLILDGRQIDMLVPRPIYGRSTMPGTRRGCEKL